ncbi:MAG TPA: ferritin-like domain-containing protein [Solirubrobacteraceae bacterium]
MTDDDLTLERIDVDGALRETLAAAEGASRAEFLRGATVATIAAVLGGAGPAEAASSKSRDISILNYALGLEYLQDAFYSEVDGMHVLHGELAEQARVVGGHERAHVKAFREVLGSAAIARPRFDFGGATETPAAFRKTAVAFEDLAVAAYKAQAPKLVTPGFLVSALSIHSVEARHAAWIRRLAGFTPAATAFDEPRSRASVTRLVADTHFVVATKRKHKRPRFTG